MANNNSYYEKRKRLPNGTPLLERIAYYTGAPIFGPVPEFPGTACTPWVGTVIGGDGNWRGQIRVGGRGRKVTRVLWEAVKGTIPDGLHVLHKCKTKECVRLDHLELGTRSKNLGADRLRDGTDSRGEKSASAILTKQDVLDIRWLRESIFFTKNAGYDGGVTQTRVAAFYGVSDATISQVLSRKVWAHI